MYACWVSDHRIKAALFLVIINNGCTKAAVLRVPNLLLKATSAPLNENEPRARVRLRLRRSAQLKIPNRQARINRVSDVESATDPTIAHRNSEAGRCVEEGEGEGGGAEVDEGGGGVGVQEEEEMEEEKEREGFNG